MNDVRNPRLDPAPARIAVAIPCFNEGGGDRDEVVAAVSGCAYRMRRSSFTTTTRPMARVKSPAELRCGLSLSRGRKGTRCERPSPTWVSGMIDR